MSSELQDLQLKFWTKFNEFVRKQKKSLNLIKAPRAHNYDMNFGRKDCQVCLTINSRSKEMECGIYIPNSKELYKKFEKHKNKYASELGKLNWFEIPNKKASRIRQMKHANIKNENEWQEYFTWMYDRTLKFAEAFKEISSLTIQKPTPTKSNNIENQFQRHPSKKLNNIYKNNPNQGANPQTAKIIFVGRDPNWNYKIESTELFSLVEEYLSDGIKFWKKYKFHHPFLHSNYSGGGKQYHKKFSKIGIGIDLAHEISFIELIGFPTVGMSKSKPKLFEELLLSNENINHLKTIDEILKSKNKIFFIAWGLINEFRIINERTGMFKYISSINKDEMNINLLNKHKNFYIHRHFSEAISYETIANIKIEIDQYIK